ncbi:hypothetical protein LCA30_20505 [Vibrio harveyi]|uniref:hypothetical protein n=1 Tax=Vibrio harveyi TaxID=669 RepID=UPI003BB74D24
MPIQIKAFIAGFLSTLVFHQGSALILYIMGIVNSTPFDMSPVEPLGIPKIFSISFFGGLWGVGLWSLIKRNKGLLRWVSAFFISGTLLTLVAFFIVFPLKEIHVDFLNPAIWFRGLFLNGMWGIGLVTFLSSNKIKTKE